MMLIVQKPVSRISLIELESIAVRFYAGKFADFS